MSRSDIAESQSRVHVDAVLKRQRVLMEMSQEQDRSQSRWLVRESEWHIGVRNESGQDRSESEWHYERGRMSQDKTEA